MDLRRHNRLLDKQARSLPLRPPPILSRPDTDRRTPSICRVDKGQARMGLPFFFLRTDYSTPPWGARSRSFGDRAIEIERGVDQRPAPSCFSCSARTSFAVNNRRNGASFAAFSTAGRPLASSRSTMHTTAATVMPASSAASMA